jgi:hypothetical protein
LINFEKEAPRMGRGGMKRVIRAISIDTGFKIEFISLVV